MKFTAPLPPFELNQLGPDRVSLTFGKQAQAEAHHPLSHNPSRGWLRSICGGGQTPRAVRTKKFPHIEIVAFIRDS